MRPMNCFLGVLVLAVSASVVGAASPQLARILPRGGQRGADVQLTFSGARLADAQEILIYRAGISVVKIEQPAKQADGRQILVTARIAADAALGEYGMRVRTASGLSEYRTFWVGPYPTVDEKEPNNDFKAPQPIAMNVTVAGVIDNEDQDHFVVEAKKGQRITAEIEGMRLGGAMFDPYVAILDENRFELSTSDDTALLKQDSVASIVAPRDGKFIIQVRESAFGGSADSHYRLHVGSFPRPRVVYPLGGPAGSSTAVQFLGDVKGPIAKTVQLPQQAGDEFVLVCEDQGLISPSGNLFRVSDFPNVMEAEPNDTPKEATTYSGTLPVAFNGIISGTSSESGDKAGTGQDTDYFKFTAKRGQALEVNVYSRRLRSPLDPVLTIYDGAGKQIATNDDSGGPDSYLRFTAPADGTYAIRVRDHLRGAGPMHAYRVEITPVHPAVALSIPQYTQQYSQERQAVTVHRGNHYATLMRLSRQDVGGPMTLTCPEMPAGVKVSAENFEPGIDTLPVLFEAAADAPVAGRLADMTAKPVDPAKAPPAIGGGFRQIVELVHGNPNNTPYYQTSAQRMAVAVAQEAPYTLSIVQPRVPLVQGGQMNLKVVAQRKKDYTGAIAVRFLFRPPGVESAAQLEIPAGQNEVLYPLNASDGATVKKWKVVVVGSADSGGTCWVSSPFAELELAPPMVMGKITTASVEQGQATKLVADLDVKTPWVGKATVELLGMPAGAVAPPVEVTSADKKVEFTIQTQKTTPAAGHNGLFLRVTLNRDGEQVVHNIARGGLLRVNPLPGTKPAPATKPEVQVKKPKAPK